VARSLPFRPDIEGLRAVAVLVVVLCHARVPFASGGYVGVDVFLVISGYLITRLLLAELAETGTVSLARFYARRVRRLLPLAMLVLGVVLVASGWLLSPLRNDTVSGDVIASALFGANFRFAAQATDYFASAEPSPVQHYWSLAVEEQFYLVWPSLLLAATWWWRRRGGDGRRALWVALALITAGSFAYGARAAALDPDLAYFSTFGRGWELSLGAMLALAPRPRMPRALAGALGFAGLAAIAVTTAAYGEGTGFPGPAALLPTLGTAAVIVAGSAHGTMGPLRVLALWPMQAIGRMSYGWYLWHWPVLVFGGVVLDGLTTPQAVALAAASLVPTVAAHRAVEQPIRRSRRLIRYPRRTVGFGFSCSAAAASLGLLLPLTQPSVDTAPARDAIGAVALDRDPTPQKRARAIRPNPRDAEEDRGAMHRDGCLVERDATRSPECAYGRRSSRTTVVLLGDSHAMHYFPALRELAEKRRWRLVGLTKAACPPAAVRIAGDWGRQCDEWREYALRRIAERTPPDMVVVGTATGYKVMRDGRELGREASDAELEAGHAATLERLRATGAVVVTIRDNQRPRMNVPECVLQSMERLEDCSFRVDRSAEEAFEVRAAKRVKGVSIVDPVPRICPRRVCPAVIGNVLVYRNTTHFTATFMRTLAPWLGRRLPRLR
jgi:peptidoglycan/LPS O-acetylase OafA/YrhL